MDWSKAKNVILIVLVLTNLFLLAVCGHRHIKQFSEDKDLYIYTMKVLEENNIFYDGEIRSRGYRVHPLTVSYGKYDRTVVKNAMAGIRKLSPEERNLEGYKAAADQLLSKCGFLTENAQFDELTESDGRVIVKYKNVYKDIPVEECSMNVYFEDGRIVDFDRKWMEVINDDDAKIAVSSQLSALLKFMAEKDTDARIDIDSISLVYWIDSYDLEGNVLYDTALPAWRIEYNSNQTAYISAA